MSRDLRSQWMATLPADAIAVTTLPSIGREYSLVEIATMTRAAPAKLLGLRDRGHLGVGAVADVAVYENDVDRAKMFRSAALVFKTGALVVRDGMPIEYGFGRALAVKPERDDAIDRRLKTYYDERYGLSDDLIKVPGHAIGRPEPFELISCRQ
jgi:formylmethanofuran dehydrogenase subunit A